MTSRPGACASLVVISVPGEFVPVMIERMCIRASIHAHRDSATANQQPQGSCNRRQLEGNRRRMEGDQRRFGGWPTAVGWQQTAVGG